jgi:hypothetical protein
MALAVSPSTLPTELGLNVKATQRNEPNDVEVIYQRYLQAFKKGVFNYIKKEMPLGSDSKKQGILPRKYFSGGLNMNMAMMSFISSPGKLPDTAMQIGVDIEPQKEGIFLNSMIGGGSMKNDWARPRVLLRGERNGGIDLTPANMNLQVKKEIPSQNTLGIKFYLDPAMLKQLQNAPGFVPVVINIQPMTNLRLFLGLTDNQPNQKTIDPTTPLL